MPIVAVPTLAMRESPQTGAQQINEGLWGEVLCIISEAGNGYVECSLEHDNYRGFVLERHIAAGGAAMPDTGAAALIPDALFVVARSTLLFTEPDIKSRVIQRLPLLSRILPANSNHIPVMSPVIEPDAQATATGTQERFVQTSDGCYALTQHLRHMNERQAKAKKGAKVDGLIEWAESLFIGAPYLWGGRTPAGCDCSGLVQSVATLAGYSLPRDSKPQEQEISNEIAVGERQRGDLVFWPGHVGILAQPDVLLHANAHSMDCRLEPLEEVTLRAGMPSSFRRLQ